MPSAEEAEEEAEASASQASVVELACQEPVALTVPDTVPDTDAELDQTPRTGRLLTVVWCRLLLECATLAALDQAGLPVLVL